MSPGDDKKRKSHKKRKNHKKESIVPPPGAADKLQTLAEPAGARREPYAG